MPGMLSLRPPQMLLQRPNCARQTPFVVRSSSGNGSATPAAAQQAKPEPSSRINVISPISQYASSIGRLL